MKNFINRALVAKKHLKLFFALFAMLALGVGNASAEKITDYSKIVTGKTYYIGATTGGTDYYLSVSGASTSTSIAGTAKTDKANATAFVFTGSGTSWTIKFADYANYLGLKSSKDNGKVQVVSSAATFTASNQSEKLRLSIGSYSIQKNNSGTQFGSYGNTQTDIWLEEVPGSSEPTTQYSIKWHTAVGTYTEETLTAGTTITKPETRPTMTGYEFMGWTEDCEVASDGAGFTAIENFGTATEDKDYYAVFAVATTTGGGAATDITIDLSKKDQITTNTTSSLVFTVGDVTFTNTKVSGSTNANNYCPGTTGKTYTSTRTYNGHQVTIASANTISKIVITAGTNAYATAIQSATWTNATASVSNTTVTITPNAGVTSVSFKPSATAGMTKVVVTTGGGTTTYDNYTTSCSGSTEPVDSLVQIAHTGDKTTFTVGDAFVKSTITATYDDATTKDVTEDATFTGYDMNTKGTQTVNVEYEGKTTSYTITVNPKPTYTITWNSIGVEVDTTIVQGEPLDTLSTVANCPNGKKFMGWTAATEVNSDGSGIVYVKENDIPTSDTTYYAVFAVVEGEEGTPTTATVSITDYADAKSWTDKQQYLDITVDANITATATGGGNTGKYYTNGENWRLYQNESATLTISAVASYEIQTVKVTYTVDNTGVLTLDGSNVTSGTAYEVNAASVTFGVGNTGSATNGQVRITAIEVVYASASKKSDFSLDCTINTNPEWTIDVDEIAFADKYVGFEYTETFTISASNLTDDIALAIDGSNFTVSLTSISKDATFPQTVTVTYAPTAAEDHNATLNITSGSALSKEIALTGSATEATIYTLTALEDIKPTDKVIIVGTSGGNTYAMSNAQGTTAAPTAVAVTVVDDKIATNETNILWNIAKNGDNLTIYPADQTAKWLYCLADENNGVRVGTGNAKEFTIDKGYLYTTQTTYARHIGIYNNADWRCYKPSEDAIANNIKDQSFAFYVLPNTDPSISVTPPRKDFGVLTVSEEATQEFEITALNINEEALTAELTGEGFNKSNIVDNKITITFAPTEVKEYSATLTISAGTEASASVTISGKGAAATYTVTYNSNGATGEAPTDDSKYVADDKVTVAGQGDMTKAGYRFAGWKYDENIYKAGATFRMPAENVTFVAQWVEKEDFSKGYWVLVTDASELNADDYVVIAAA